MRNSFSKVPNYRGAYLIFCLSLITLPINTSLSGIARLSDIFIIITVAAIASTNPDFKKTSVIIFSAFYIVLLSSDLLQSSLHKIRYEGVVFYYKYFLLFIIPYIVSLHYTVLAIEFPYSHHECYLNFRYISKTFYYFLQ